jgi:hypothetical protein
MMWTKAVVHDCFFLLSTEPMGHGNSKRGRGGSDGTGGTTPDEMEARINKSLVSFKQVRSCAVHVLNW